MTRWAPDAALRLEQAAMQLFEEQGYAATTVPQITARAGLTTRTFFRHFTDKREVLFLRDREFPAVVGGVLDDLPAELAPLALVEQGLLAASEPLEGWRDDIRRRRAVILADERLRERELLKSARLADAVEAALTARGTGRADARLLSLLSVAVFNAALEQWLDDPGPGLAACLRSTWARMTSLAAPATGA